MILPCRPGCIWQASCARNVNVPVDIHTAADLFKICNLQVSGMIHVLYKTNTVQFNAELPYLLLHEDLM